ncbi:TPR repeat [Polymorphum gilvum SL003B-26A1]|uniref:TPR repeat n=1 Tax=Polymorphum gilvum (strain LMG 25793 / CGMCC 1.9160 / SL003B-26A1) TaxID=991905 RepID=F2J4Z7_POLGS|nr:TPR repeat [Polymorphum gilvum SL003B-26A1]
MCFVLGAGAHAEVRPDQSYGTPQDLPITLSGSYLAGRLAGQQNDFASASAFFEETLAADPDNPFLLERAFILKTANGEIAKALAYAEEMETAGIDNFLARLVVAVGHVRNGDYRSAAAELETAGAGPLADLTSGITRAWALLGTGNADEALAAIDALEGPEWFDVFKANHAALIAEQAGRQDLALEKIEAAYNADRGALRVNDAFARIRAAAGKKEEALEVLTEYDRLMPGDPLLTNTRRLIESGAPILPLVSDPAQGIAELLNGLGSAIGRDGAEELASAYLQLALYLNPKTEFAAIALGSLFERMGNPQRAIEVLKTVPNESPLKRNAEIQIGFNYNALDQLDKAREHLSALIALDPAELEAVISLGNVLRSHKLFEEAEAVYSRGLDTVASPERQHWALFYYRGICRERLKQWPAAEADFRKSLELFPDQPLVLNYLGYSLVDQGLKLDEALDMIRRAVELRPNDGYIVDSLGWVYYRLGRYEEAVKELERAVELRPADPVINDHLGDAYWKVGRKLEARFQWNHARDLGPEPEELPKILDKIENGLTEAPAAGAATADAPRNGG